MKKLSLNRILIVLVVLVVVSIIAIISIILLQYRGVSILNRFETKYINNNEELYFNNLSKEPGIDSIFINQSNCSKSKCEIIIRLKEDINVDNFANMKGVILENSNPLPDFNVTQVRSFSVTGLSDEEVEEYFANKNNIYEVNDSFSKSEYSGIEDLNNSIKEKNKLNELINQYSDIPKNFITDPDEKIESWTIKQKQLIDEYGSYDEMPVELQELYDLYSERIEREKRNLK